MSKESVWLERVAASDQISRCSGPRAGPNFRELATIESASTEYGVSNKGLQSARSVMGRFTTSSTPTCTTE